jgi:glycerol-3-phosphate dehydrogenase (NAD(P)+)
MDKILVVGGGSWGTAFANYLSRNSRRIKLWLREEEIIGAIKNTRENPVFLPGIKLSGNLLPVANLEEEAEAADILIFAVPSKFIRRIFERLKGIAEAKTIVNLTKGFESASLKTISQLAAEVSGEDILRSWVTISGPSFARELAQNHPTAVAAASKNEKVAQKIQHEFSSETLRIYRTDDLVGIEVGGSMKNVMAIASGIVNGSGYGYNTTASLVTRGSVEIARIGHKLGARRETFWGLAGIGDLMLTCFGSLSRNFQLGVKIARGQSLETIEKTTQMVAEGVETTRAMKDLSDRLGIEMPITTQVHEVLFNRKKPESGLKELMTRSLKAE